MRIFLQNLWARKRRLIGTSTAVVLGVAFLAATLVLGDTTKAGFNNVFSAANAGTDVVVRNATRLGGSEDRVTGFVDEAELDTIAATAGVASAAPSVEGIAQLVDADGEKVGGEGPPTFGVNWIDDPDLANLALAEGAAPRPVADGEPFEVVIDANAADDADLAVGDNGVVLTPDRVAIHVVGIAEFANDGDSAGATFVAFETDAAQRLFTGSDSTVSSILVHADDGVSGDALATTIGAELPSTLEAITGSDLTAEQQADVDEAFLGMFRTMLLAFSGIAVVVAAFSINNTFSILVAQRTRESALMRAVGASRRQVLTSVALEALAVGVVATGVGFGAGLGIAAGLRSLMESGLDMPSSGLVIGSGAVIASVIVGVGTALLASIGPAVRASRVAPLAALRDAAFDRSGASKVRGGVGLLLVGVGVIWLITASTAGENALARAGLGAAALVIGAVVIGPVIARPAAAVIGAFPALTRGVSGSIARRNAMRNPRRTAASASALLVGTAVVGLFTTFGASIKQSVTDTVDQNFNGDLVITPDGFGGSPISPELPAAIGDVDGVAAAIGTSYGPALIGDDTVDLASTDVAALGSVFDVSISDGTFDAFGDDALAVSEQYALEHDLAVGAMVPISFADGETVDFQVAAVYEDRMTFGDLLVSTNALAEHTARTNLTVVLVAFDDAIGDSGPSFDATKAAVDGVAADFFAPDAMDRAEYEETISGEVDAMLYVVYGMLAVAVLIAVLGIGNTLALSIHDRTRELGLLRAVGQDRSKLRSSVRWESVIVSVFGTVGGIGIGTFAAWGIMRALNEQEGFGSFALPVAPLVVIVGLSAAAGVVAAIRPARRAARTDILAAIASD